MAADQKYPKYVGGITVYSPDAENYFCCICTEYSDESWEAHLQSEKHRVIFKYYTRSFTDSGAFATCTLCNKRLEKNSVTAHAIGHNLIPWCRPSEEFEIYFKNFLTKFGNKYYCHLCQVNLPFWFLAVSHTADTQHQQLKTSRTDTITTPEFLKLLSYDFLSCNCIFLKGSGGLSCIICGVDVGLSHLATLEHTATVGHQESQQIFIKNLKSTRSTVFSSAIDDVRVNLQLKAQDKVDSCRSANSTVDFEDNQVQYLSRKNGTERLSGADSVDYGWQADENSSDIISNRITGTELPLGIVQMENKKFRCNLCNSTINLYQRIDKHCNTKGHRRELKNYTSEKLKFTNKVALIKSAQSSSSSNTNDCKINLSLSEERSKSTMQKNSPPTSTSGRQIYIAYCDICCLDILAGPGDIANHNESNGHVTQKVGLRKKGKPVPKDVDPNAVDNSQTEYFVIQESFGDYFMLILQMRKDMCTIDNETFLWCKLCDCKVRTDKAQKHLSNRYHKNRVELPRRISEKLSDKNEQRTADKKKRKLEEISTEPTAPKNLNPFDNDNFDIMESTVCNTWLNRKQGTKQKYYSSEMQPGNLKTLLGSSFQEKWTHHQDESQPNLMSDFELKRSENKHSTDDIGCTDYHWSDSAGDQSSVEASKKVRPCKSADNDEDEIFKIWYSPLPMDLNTRSTWKNNETDELDVSEVINEFLGVARVKTPQGEENPGLTPEVLLISDRNNMKDLSVRKAVHAANYFDLAERPLEQNQVLPLPNKTLNTDYVMGDQVDFFVCKLCSQVVIGGAENLTLHCYTGKHRNGRQNVLPEIQSVADENFEHALDPLVHYYFLGLQDNNIIKLQRTAVEGSVIHEGYIFWCNICNCMLSNESVIESHLNGSSAEAHCHRQYQEEVNNAVKNTEDMLDNNLPKTFYSNICRRTYTNESVLTEYFHFKSQKHLKNLTQLQSQVSVAERFTEEKNGNLRNFANVNLATEEDKQDSEFSSTPELANDIESTGWSEDNASASEKSNREDSQTPLMNSLTTFDPPFLPNKELHLVICKICNRHIAVTGSFSEHENSDGHTKKQRKWHRKNKILPSTASNYTNKKIFNYSISPIDQSILILREKWAQSSFGQTLLWCAVCECKFKNLVNIECHISGTRHKRNLENARNINFLTGSSSASDLHTEDEQPEQQNKSLPLETLMVTNKLGSEVYFFTCKICNHRVLGGRENVGAHRYTVEHVSYEKRRLRETQSLPLYSFEYSQNPSTFYYSGWYGDECITRLLEVPREDPAGEKIFFWCNVCSISLLDESSVYDHLTITRKTDPSLTHKANVKKFNRLKSNADELRRSGVPEVFRCEVCDCTLMNHCSDSEYRHKKSKRHLKQLKKLNEAAQPTTLDSIQTEDNEDQVVEDCASQSEDEDNFIGTSNSKEHLKNLERLVNSASEELSHEFEEKVGDKENTFVTQFYHNSEQNRLNASSNPNVVNEAVEEIASDHCESDNTATFQETRQKLNEKICIWNTDDSPNRHSNMKFEKSDSSSLNSSPTQNEESLTLNEDDYIVTCKICRCEFFGVSGITEHDSSHRHQTNQRRWHRKGKVLPPQIYFYDQKTLFTQYFSGLGDSILLLKQRFLPHLDEKVLYWCTTCNCKLTSPSAVDDHIRAPRHQKHKTKIKTSLNQSQDANVDFIECTLCTIRLKREQGTKQQHYNSEMHRKNLERLLCPPPQEKSNDREADVQPNLMADFRLSTSESLYFTENIATGNPENTRRTPHMQTNVFIDCEICNRKIEGGHQFVIEHRSSQEHQNNERMLSQSLRTSADADLASPPNCSPSELSEHANGENIVAILTSMIHQAYDPNGQILFIECRACDLKLYGARGTSVFLQHTLHMASEGHLKNEKIFFDNWKAPASNSVGKKSKSAVSKRLISRNEDLFCRVCFKKFKDNLTLHVHLAGHFHVKFNPIFAELHREATSATIDNESVDLHRSKTSENSNETGQSAKPPLKRLSLKHLTRAKLDIAFEDDQDIYKIDEQALEDVKLGAILSYAIDSEHLYCLVCRRPTKNTVQSFYEHLRSVEHLDYLQQMIDDHRKFKNCPNQLSDLALASHYMQETSDTNVECYACGMSIQNDSNELKKHIETLSHIEERLILNENCKKYFNVLHSIMEGNFYSVKSYWCVVCCKKFSTEVEFRNHLSKKKHARNVRKYEGYHMLIFDYCAVCATLWYGFLKTFSYHSECRMHKFHRQDGFFLVSNLPPSAHNLLKNAEQITAIILTTQNNHRTSESLREEKLLQNLLQIARQVYIDAQVYPFGSRMSRLANKTSDLDVFLDCGTPACAAYQGQISNRNEVEKRLMAVKKCLESNQETWRVDREILDCRTPIIRAVHQPTGIACDISFTNGLTVENTRLIGTYCQRYPDCRKLITFVNSWLGHCELSDLDGINSYGAAWLVIYFLQVKAALPSVHELIRMQNQSKIIDVWETGFSADFNALVGDESFRDLLMQLFEFYADFDYRHDVICPLLGVNLKKTEFKVPNKLPSAMEPYLRYLERYKDAEALRIDSLMCLQDPFDLAHNITEAVNKFTVYRFKTFCSYSAQTLKKL